MRKMKLLKCIKERNLNSLEHNIKTELSYCELNRSGDEKNEKEGKTMDDNHECYQGRNTYEGMERYTQNRVK